MCHEYQVMLDIKFLSAFSIQVKNEKRKKERNKKKKKRNW